VIVVSDASPLTNLAAIGRLDLLRDLYQRVLIPRAVAVELQAGDALGAHAELISRAEWIETRTVADRAAVDELLAELELGEAEAIVLAGETHADFLLMDERIGREIAAGRGLRAVGLLGTLVTAKRKGLLAAAKPVLDALVQDAGFWVGDALYQEVLRELGE
jgi:predicted nucleic acid-binding protein